MTQLLEYTTKHYSGTDDDNMKVLHRRLIQSGIYDPRAVAGFFIAQVKRLTRRVADRIV